MTHLQFKQTVLLVCAMFMGRITSQRAHKSCNVNKRVAVELLTLGLVHPVLTLGYMCNYPPEA